LLDKILTDCRHIYERTKNIVYHIVRITTFKPICVAGYDED